MAIRDLLWACPLCQRIGTLRSQARVERCSNCSASFRRGHGAEIVAIDVRGERFVMPAADWLQRLPVRAENWGSPEPAAVRLKIPSGKKACVRDGELLGWIDRLGPARQGTLSLHDDHLRFEGDDGSCLEWPLDQITAVQPSSTSLQIKARGQPVASLGFPLVSVRLWEDAIQDFIRRRWRAAGRGEIVEFQPMIRTW